MKTTPNSTIKNHPIYHPYNSNKTYNHKTMLPTQSWTVTNLKRPAAQRKAVRNLKPLITHLYNHYTEKGLRTPLKVRNLTNSNPSKTSHYQPNHLITKTWHSHSQFANH